MGIALDPQKQLIHSVGKDKRYYVYDTKKKAVASAIDPSPHGLSGIIV
jgi:hypothetical protein